MQGQVKWVEAAPARWRQEGRDPEPIVQRLQQQVTLLMQEGNIEQAEKVSDRVLEELGTPQDASACYDRNRRRELYPDLRNRIGRWRAHEVILWQLAGPVRMVLWPAYTGPRYLRHQPEGAWNNAIRLHAWKRVGSD